MNFINFFEEEVVSEYSDTDTVIEITDASRLTAPCTLVIYNRNYSPAEAFRQDEAEIVRVTDIDEDDLTVERGVDGTSAITIGEDTYKVIMSATAQTFDQSVGKHVVSIKGFGVQPETDAGDEIQDAIDYAGSLDLEEVDVLFPVGEIYYTEKTITCKHTNVNLKMFGELQYTSDDEDIIVDIEDGEHRRHTLNTYRQDRSDWSNEDAVGVRVTNCDECRFDIIRSTNSTVNLMVKADDAGSSYNEFYVGELRDGKIQVLLEDHNDGWVNQNTFYGGRLWNASGTKADEDRWGVVIRSADGVYGRNNNNVFFHQNVELQGDSGKSVGFRLEGDAWGNVFYKPRTEGIDTCWELRDNARYNILEVGYNSEGDLEDDQSEDGRNFVVPQHDEMSMHYVNQKVCDFSDLASKAIYADTDSVWIDGLGMSVSGNPTIYTDQDDITIEDDHLDIDGARGVGVCLDVENSKEFLVKVKALNSHAGRLLVRAYDSDDNVITDDEDAISGQVGFWSSFDGWRQGSDNDGSPVYFKVLSDDVAYVYIAIFGGTDNAELQGFSIYTRGDGHVNIFPGHGEAYGMGKVTMDGEPSQGRFEKGEVIWNYDPSADEYSGWRCNSSGDFDGTDDPSFEGFAMGDNRVITRNSDGKVDENIDLHEGRAIVLDGYSVITAYKEVDVPSGEDLVITCDAGESALLYITDVSSRYGAFVDIYLASGGMGETTISTTNTSVSTSGDDLIISGIDDRTVRVTQLAGEADLSITTE